MDAGPSGTDTIETTSLGGCWLKVSLLDFWIPAQSVGLVVYAHSLDFGEKAHGNLIELAMVQTMLARELGRPVGK